MIGAHCMDRPERLVVAIGGKKLQFAMPATAWATIKYRP